MSTLRIESILGKVKGYRIPADFTIEVHSDGKFNFNFHSSKGRDILNLSIEEQQKIVLKALVKADKPIVRKETFFQIQQLKYEYHEVTDDSYNVVIALFKDENGKDFILRSIDDIKEWLEWLLENEEEEVIRTIASELLDDVEFDYENSSSDLIALFEAEDIFKEFGFELLEENSHYEVLDLGVFYTLEEAKAKAESKKLKHYYIKEFKF